MIGADAHPPAAGVAAPGLLVGIDVGGTFTDLVAVDTQHDRVYRAKLLTSEENPAGAILAGLDDLLRDAGRPLPEVAYLVHGTTRAGNALIERTGATVGLITTDGFRDVLEMGNEMRYDLYDLSLRRAEPLVPRRRRRGVLERIDADGSVVTPLAEDQLLDEAAQLIDGGATSLAVCFLHAYANPIHEQQAQALLSAHHPGVPVTVSSLAAPELREFERFSTAVANAYIVPLIDAYLRELQDVLHQRGFRGALLIMMSNGGVNSVAAARALPIHMVESGPAGGILAAAHAARFIQGRSVLAFDMGGTTAKLSLVEGGSPKRSHGLEIARVHRFKRGSGLPLRLPVLDLVEIGAGGGSVAWVDGMGLLKVGPNSAGADPGPVCYGRGGTRPTVTDADLALGLLNPDFFLGGQLQLDPDRARDAIAREVAEPLGMTVDEAARGIYTIVGENMAQAARMYLSERGADPRRFTLVASGGAGPVHAYEVARRLKMPEILYPFGAGVASAHGFLTAPPSIDVVRSVPMPLDSLDAGFVSSLFDDMAAAASQHLGDLGVDRDSVSLAWSVDMRYLGQGFEVSVDLDGVTADAATLATAFDHAYQREYGRAIANVPVEVVAWRVAATGPAPELPPQTTDQRAPRVALKGQRVVFAEGADGQPCNVYDRYALVAGDTIDGPAIIEERESTIYVGPDGHARVDREGNVLVTITAT